MTGSFAGPGAAFDDFMATRAAASRSHRMWQTSDGPLPAIFLSHGAPPLFDDAAWIDELFAWSLSMPKPTAIVVLSAHWESAPVSLSASAAGTPLVYDFAGFAARYFGMTYATPDAGDVARLVTSLLPDDEPVYEHPSRGLDHGAWVPLKVMYPWADVPVVQMSLPTHDPERLMSLGRRLQPLRDSGVLLIGSGFMTHGLPFLTREMFFGDQVAGWSRDFDDWAADALTHGRLEELMSYAGAPGMPYAHPTPEHFTPLFVALGAGSSDDSAITTAIDGYAFGLAKRSIEVR